MATNPERIAASWQANPSETTVRMHGGGEVVNTDRRAADCSSAEFDWALLRRAQPANTLLDQSRRWLFALPANIRPSALPQFYPRIINQLACAWHDNECLNSIFGDLLIDHRGNRSGFPPPVRRELISLWRHWRDDA
ncbi:MAG: hypothetical protein U1F10_00450 [Burkholderiales bacterium]